jgi:hypothetical protein
MYMAPVGLLLQTNDEPLNDDLPWGLRVRVTRDDGTLIARGVHANTCAVILLASLIILISYLGQ